MTSTIAIALVLVGALGLGYVVWKCFRLLLSAPADQQIIHLPRLVGVCRAMEDVGLVMLAYLLDSVIDPLANLWARRPRLLGAVSPAATSQYKA